MASGPRALATVRSDVDRKSLMAPLLHGIVRAGRRQQRGQRRLSPFIAIPGRNLPLRPWVRRGTDAEAAPFVEATELPAPAGQPGLHGRDGRTLHVRNLLDRVSVDLEQHDDLALWSVERRQRRGR